MSCATEDDDWTPFYAPIRKEDLLMVNKESIVSENKRELIHIDLAQPHVWITARVEWDDDESTLGPKEWHILGVYTDEEKAKQRCRQYNDVVYALPLNIDLPEEIVGVDNEYYPLGEGQEEE